MSHGRPINYSKGTVTPPIRDVTLARIQNAGLALIEPDLIDITQG